MSIGKASLHLLVTVCDIKRLSAIRERSIAASKQTTGRRTSVTGCAFAELSVPPVCQNCASKKVGNDRHAPLTPISKPSEYKSENFHLLANLSSKCAHRFRARSTTHRR